MPKLIHPTFSDQAQPERYEPLTSTAGKSTVTSGALKLIHPMFSPHENAGMSLKDWPSAPFARAKIDRLNRTSNRPNRFRFSIRRWLFAPLMIELLLTLDSFRNSRGPS